MVEWNWTEGYDMSGWHDDGKAKILEVEIDLQEASEWMENLCDDLTQEEREIAIKTGMDTLSEKWKDDPEDQKKKKPRPSAMSRPDIRPSEVRLTELEPETKKVHFYSGYKVISGKWLGSRPLDEWPPIFEHMKKSMNPSHDDVNTPQLKWVPKEN